jgi:hypothetical protein
MLGKLRVTADTAFLNLLASSGIAVYNTYTYTAFLCPPTEYIKAIQVKHKSWPSDRPVPTNNSSGN